MTSVLVPGEERSCVLNPGDGMIYKGCERPHWRDEMPNPSEPVTKLFRNKKKKKDKKSEYYYHQIFFHYVLQDGERAHCAWDRSR